MSVKFIEKHLLIESPSGESEGDFRAAIERMLLTVYGQRPDWLQFSAGERFVRAGRHFREFVCVAGSVSLMLMQRARQAPGFHRSIIYQADDEGTARAYEIHAGEETPFVPSELGKV
jgi:hypothetical protein